eukprot:7117791-Alexandrium_andersonii.AAC.1
MAAYAVAEERAASLQDQGARARAPGGEGGPAAAARRAARATGPRPRVPTPRLLPQKERAESGR